MPRHTHGRPRRLGGLDLDGMGFHAPQAEQSKSAKKITAPKGTKKIAHASLEERLPYMQACLGRPLDAESLRELMSCFEHLQDLNLLQRSGLVYVAGSDLKKDIRYGYAGPDKPNRTPEEVISAVLNNVRRIHPLAASVDEPLTVPLQRLTYKKWGQDHLKIQAVLRDVDTTDYPQSGQILGESTATVEGTRQLNISTGSVELPSLGHVVPLAIGDLALAGSVEAAIQAYPVGAGTAVRLDRMGFVEMPFTIE